MYSVFSCIVSIYGVSKFGRINDSEQDRHGVVTPLYLSIISVLSSSITHAIHTTDSNGPMQDSQACTSYISSPMPSPV